MSLPGNLAELDQAASHVTIVVQHSDDKKRYRFRMRAWQTINDLKMRTTKQPRTKDGGAE